MTQPFDDEHGDRLRRALHAEAEAVTPSPEGLERIRKKIDQRNERRLGLFSPSLFSLSSPWLRPLAAVAAAVCVCLAAASVTPALANFVQTGHFSPAGGDDGKTTTNDGRSEGQVPPNQPPSPVPSVSPSPSAPHPSSTGKHVVTGSCQPGEETVTPSGSPAAGGAAAGTTSEITCQPVPGGSDTSSAPVTEAPPTSSPPSPPDAPSDQPTSESDPTVNANQSP
jgi:hypothetical protein